MAMEDDKNVVVMQLEGDEKFDYKPEAGDTSTTHEEQAKGFDQNAEQLGKLLAIRKKEVAQLRDLQAKGVVTETAVANKEVEVTQIEADLETAKRNASLARDAAEKTPPATKAEEVVYPIDWEKEGKENQ